MSAPRKQRTVLLATFTFDKSIDPLVREIYDSFRVEYGKVLVFHDLDQIGRTILTYNVFADSLDQAAHTKFKNTIKINRKHDTNTLYTINSLNKVVIAECGKIDPSYKVDWLKYRDQMLLTKTSPETKEQSLCVSRIKMVEAIDRRTFFQAPGVWYPPKD